MKGKVVLFEMLGGTLLGASLAIVSLLLGMTSFVVLAPMCVIAIFSVRRGETFGLKIALLIALCITIGIYVKNGEWSGFTYLVYHIYYSIATVIGMFAQNIHRNLNNKKMSTVQLNIVTAQVVSAGLMALFTFLNSKPLVLWLDCVVYGCVSIIVLLVLVYVQPKIILTSRSQYLSSKERSKLLND